MTFFFLNFSGKRSFLRGFEPGDYHWLCSSVSAAYCLHGKFNLNFG